LFIVHDEKSEAYFTTPKPRHKYRTITLANPILIILNIPEMLNKKKLDLPDILIIS